jgi:EAL domain-containing protein (putative c-di-GMP-specific phosphodiesterase class I)
MSRTTAVAGREVTLTASIGKAVARDGSDDGSLLRDADTALHAAKRAGGNRCVVFDDALRNRAVARLDVEAQLRRALDAGELVAHHQPITRIDGTWRGTEALVRWQHPQRGLLAPFSFLDVAEESGLVVPLGQQVLRAACADAARWRLLRPGFAVSVNIAARHLASGHVVDDVVAALDAARLPGDALTLEITETALLVDDEVVGAALQALRALGCHVALDDFGTGYSSLAHLRDFPVDVLKVDRSFVAAAPSSAEAARLLRGICSLGRALGLTVVAEGVEDAAARAAAVAGGADLLQGYLFGRPAPAATIDAALGSPEAAR